MPALPLALGLALASRLPLVGLVTILCRVRAKALRALVHVGGVKGAWHRIAFTSLVLRAHRFAAPI
eukprot:8383904-Lingulodinium_polyedra.AAC.1